MPATRREFLFDVGRLVVVACVPVLPALGAGCGTDQLEEPTDRDSGAGPSDSGASDSGSGDSGPSDSGSGDAAPVSCANVDDTIGGNHPTPHVLDTITEADVTAGAMKTYALSVSGAHSHSITLTTADFAMLRAGATVTKTSTSGGGHMHSVMVACV